MEYFNNNSNNNNILKNNNINKWFWIFRDFSYGFCLVLKSIEEMFWLDNFFVGCKIISI